VITSGVALFALIYCASFYTYPSPSWFIIRYSEELPCVEAFRHAEIWQTVRIGEHKSRITKSLQTHSQRRYWWLYVIFSLPLHIISLRHSNHRSQTLECHTDHLPQSPNSRSLSHTHDHHGHWFVTVSRFSRHMIHTPTIVTVTWLSRVICHYCCYPIIRHLHP